MGICVYAEKLCFRICVQSSPPGLLNIMYYEIKIVKRIELRSRLTF